ncbi:MAG: DNA polymerase I [Bacillaceae bacterium G1]|nr:MAG: DNA polymerase I [Bacillaceae bacterium G1]
MLKKLILLDGNSLANRAFYALPLLSTEQGVYTNAVYGFTTMLLKLLEEERPTHMLVAFDAGKRTFRHDTYGEYKGGRQKTPPELSEQFPLLKELLAALSIPQFEMELYEADDIIGTLADQAVAEGYDVLVVTGDKDLLQLVSPDVKVMLTRRGITDVEVYDEAAVERKYGLKPAQIVDLKGLMGDASDNIPGIPGVGEKTALKLLHQYGTVENIVAHADELPGAKLRERVKEHGEMAMLSKRLATIYREVPLPYDVSALALPPMDPERAVPVFRKLAFHSLLDRLPAAMEKPEGERPADAQAAETEPLSYRLLDQAAAEALVDVWRKSRPAIWLELEPAPWQPEILGLGVSWDDETAFIPVSVLRGSEKLLAWLADADAKKIVYDGKQAKVALVRHGMDLAGIDFDYLLASYLLNPSSNQHQLSDVARMFGETLEEDEAVFGRGAKRQRPAEDVWQRHAVKKCAFMVRRVADVTDRLKEDGLYSLYQDLEMPLSMVLAALEIRGFKVDGEKLKEMGAQFQARLERLTEEIYALAGTEFNINSPKQLGEILFDKLGLPVIKKTKTGYSTSADVLEKLAPYHEIVEKILYYRQLGKLLSTYVDGLLKMIHPKTGKIHTSFNQAITATGRLSSTEPNLQNIPIRLEEGRRIRQAFVPSQPGWTILSADYSQIELRILAHLSQDERLVDAFRKGMDIHTKTAMDIFGVPQEAVTPEMRRQAKAVNFGIIYGISDYGLSQNLNIPRKEAAAFIERYFETFPGVKKYMDQAVQTAREKGYVTTILNRRRYLPEINSRNYNLRSFAERTAMNTPIQGSAADIIKLAMIRLEEEMRRRGMASQMLLQVHDELICEVHPDEREEMYALVREVMEQAVPLKVPLKVDVSDGPTWYDAK